MAAKTKLPKKTMGLRQNVSPKVQKGTRADLTKACKGAEVETAQKAVEFVQRIGQSDKWTLDDWAELDNLAGMGRFFCEIRLAFTEIEEVESVV